jgi:hypothetical protein
MLPPVRFGLATSLLVLAAALAACGGSGVGDRQEVEDTLVESALSTDPADCTRLFTRKVLEQTTKLRGEAAVRICEEEAAGGESAAEGASVAGIEIEGGEATADVSFEGSDFDGQTLTMALVEDDGAWKIDELLAFAELDREKLVLQFGRDIYSYVGSSVDAGFAECVLARLEGLGDPGLEALILDPSPDPLRGLVQGCEGSESA